MGVPPVIIHFDRIFHEVNHPAIGVSRHPHLWKPSYDIYNWNRTRPPRPLDVDSLGGPPKTLELSHFSIDGILPRTERFSPSELGDLEQEIWQPSANGTEGLLGGNQATCRDSFGTSWWILLAGTIWNAHLAVATSSNQSTDFAVSRTLQCETTWQITLPVSDFFPPCLCVAPCEAGKWLPSWWGQLKLSTK